ncbi:hypothetical protein C8R43DRAFT_996641 [Mycena crocata]|nr:hypothetical protein C8R43DRAFT_996641 [Mycena crocata]
MFNKVFLLLITVAAASVNAVVTPVPASNAAGSCSQWSLVPDTATLSASCATSSGTRRATTIPISQCVGNTNGNLVCKAGGNAGSSCKFFDIEASSGSFTISATCLLPGAINTVTVNHFNINQCLSNNEGTLTC